MKAYLLDVLQGMSRNEISCLIFQCGVHPDNLLSKHSNTLESILIMISRYSTGERNYSLLPRLIYFLLLDKYKTFKEYYEIVKSDKSKRSERINRAGKFIKRLSITEIKCLLLTIGLNPDSFLTENSKVNEVAYEIAATLYSTQKKGFKTSKDPIIKIYKEKYCQFANFCQKYKEKIYT